MTDPAPLLAALLMMFLGLGTTALLAPGMRRRAEGERGKACEAVAKALGLRRTPTGVGGVADGFGIAVSWSTARDGDHSAGLWNITVEDRARRISPGLVAGLPGDPKLPDAAGLDRRTGDEALDARVTLRGDARWHAVLDAATRRLLGGIAHQPSFSLDGGRIEITDHADSGGGDGARLAGILTLVLQFAGRLTIPPGEVPQRLAENARKDPDPRVRWRNLEVLTREFPERPESREALRAALEDPHPEVRLRAAAAGGEDGFDTLAGLARTPAAQRDRLWERELQRAGGAASGRLWWELELPDGSKAPPSPFDMNPAAADSRRARALDHLAGSFPVSRALPLVREALEGPPPLQVAALAALRQIGSAADEAAAIAALSSGHVKVRSAAIRALEAIGTAEAVPHLRAIAEASPLSLALGRAAGEAIVKIQKRLVGAAAGQVALTGDGGAGRVALAGGSAGTVALPPGDASSAGRPGLPADEGQDSLPAPARPRAEGRG